MRILGFGKPNPEQQRTETKLRYPQQRRRLRTESAEHPRRKPNLRASNNACAHTYGYRRGAVHDYPHNQCEHPNNHTCIRQCSYEVMSQLFSRVLNHSALPYFRVLKRAQVYSNCLSASTKQNANFYCIRPRMPSKTSKLLY